MKNKKIDKKLVKKSAFTLYRERKATKKKTTLEKAFDKVKK